MHASKEHQSRASAGFEPIASTATQASAYAKMTKFFIDLSSFICCFPLHPLFLAPGLR
jgi:hypothetical protein